MKVNDFVIWPRHTEYGIGTILDIRDGTKAIVFFDRLDGTEMLILSALEPSSKTFDTSRIPQRIELHKKQQIKKHQSTAKKSTTKKPGHLISHLIQTFLAIFPKGFLDEKYIEQERKYKEEAAKTFQAKLSEHEFLTLLNNNNFSAISNAAVQVVKSTNLINPQWELPKVQDKLKKTEYHKPFAETLYYLLYGSEGSEESTSKAFTNFVGVLTEMDVASWQFTTIYPFFMDYTQHILVQPSYAKRFADAFSLEINYKSNPSWSTYSRIRVLAERVCTTLSQEAVNDPRLSGIKDMIDIQSFMYVCLKENYP